jgi:hypothetical protein
LCLGGLSDEIEIAAASPEAGEAGGIAAVDHFKSERAIEAHGLRHVSVAKVIALMPSIVPALSTSFSTA